MIDHLAFHSAILYHLRQSTIWSDGDIFAENEPHILPWEPTRKLAKGFFKSSQQLSQIHSFI
jgi:hypothetical protein